MLGYLTLFKRKFPGQATPDIRCRPIVSANIFRADWVKLNTTQDILYHFHILRSSKINYFRLNILIFSNSINKSMD